VAKESVAKDFIEVWERVGFEDGKAVSWSKSMDNRKTWEEVDWSMYGNPPFILINPSPAVEWVMFTERRKCQKNP